MNFNILSFQVFQNELNKDLKPAIFNRKEFKLVTCELMVSNNLFMKEDWTSDISILCFDLINNWDVCSNYLTLVGNKFKQIIEISELWGDEENEAFWEPSNYKAILMQNDNELASFEFEII